jgi:hypothetical protein
MRSRGARLTLVAGAVLALGAASAYLIRSDRAISARRSAVREFDTHAWQAISALSEGRAALVAYVAVGQTAEVWRPKVIDLSHAAAAAVDALRPLAGSTVARAALMEAAATITSLGAVDRHALEYLASGHLLMAADVVLAEGNDVWATAARQIQTARDAEHDLLQSEETAARTGQTVALTAGAGLAGLALLILGLTGGASTPEAGIHGDEAAENTSAGLHRRLVPLETATASSAAPQEIPRHSAESLKAAAHLCTDLARSRDAVDLTRVLGHAAEAMDASGIVVWLANAGDGDLWPVLAHGYAPQALARMAPVPRASENATAKAYRTGLLQIVLSRPGATNGALAAPLLSPQGCIGSLSAEITGRSETSDGVQALAVLLAAQLATILVPPTNAAETQDEKAATA